MMITQRYLVEKYEIESCSFQIKHFLCLQPFIKTGLRIRIQISKRIGSVFLIFDDRTRIFFNIDLFFQFNGNFIWYDPDSDSVFLEDRIRSSFLDCRIRIRVISTRIQYRLSSMAQVEVAYPNLYLHCT